MVSVIVCDECGRNVEVDERVSDVYCNCGVIIRVKPRVSRGVSRMSV